MKFWGLFLVFTVCMIATASFAASPAMITADEVNTLVGKPDVKIIDTRNAIKYRLGHIPGAINVSMTDFDDAGAKYKNIRGDAALFEKVASNLGINPADTVIFVGGAKETQPYRLWWVFRSFNHKGRLAVLDGGMDTWTGETKLLAPDVLPTAYKVENADANAIIMMDELAKKVGDKNTVIVDVRAPDEYTGKTVASGAAKGGRIAGSVLVPHMKAWGEDGKIIPADALKKMYEDAGVTPDKEIIVYCQGGVRAAVSYYALSEVLGYPNVRNYDGSWAEWSDSENPSEKD